VVCHALREVHDIGLGNESLRVSERRKAKINQTTLNLKIFAQQRK
jgi:hypothetical protein